ncbi:MAG: hypothetical protein R3E96_05555 [Planctomycetota bacterium]
MAAVPDDRAGGNTPARAGEDLPALLPSIERWQADLAAEGFQASAVAVGFEESSGHRDGRVLLGLRDWLRAEAEKAPLAGVLLVGRFPDALLVRSVNWRKQGKIEIDGEAYADMPTCGACPKTWPTVPTSCSPTSMETGRACYREHPSCCPRGSRPIRRAFPKRADLSHGETGQKPFEDFFLVDDGRHGEWRNTAWTWTVACLNPRVAAGELRNAEHPGPTRHLVGRLDARGWRWCRGPSAHCSTIRASRCAGTSSQAPHWRDGLWQ